MAKNKGTYPQEGELVIATITKIQYHSVFCSIDEYGTSGMIHISEIAPGRIKNITDYVSEGKTIITKVLRVDEKKGHVDLSIRRVTEAQRRQKAAQIKQRQLSEKIVEQLAAEVKGDKAKLLAELEKTLEGQGLFSVFQAVVEDGHSLVDSGVRKELVGPLEKLIKERIKPQEVSIKGAYRIHCFEPDGVERIKKAFSSLQDGVNVVYAGGGSYTVQIVAKDYKEAEGLLKDLTGHVNDVLSENAFVNFARTDK